MVDLLFLAWNRLKFTSATWAWMLAHTDWGLVSNLIVYDDGSEDGTMEFLRDHVDESPVPYDFRLSDFRSPVGAMNHYLATSEADFFAKVDNDIALPGGWLNNLVDTQARNPEYELVGMEAGMVEMEGRDGKRFDGIHTITPATNIGGVGLMSVHAFRSRPRIPERGRYGFTEWQTRYEPVRGWITPDLNVPQLDRIPAEPWVSLTEEYVENGWSRSWPKYSEKWMEPYWTWLLPQEVEA